MTNSQTNQLNISAALLEIGKIDTLYRDLYLQRARALIEPILPSAEYVRRRNELDAIGAVENQLRIAVSQADWQRAQELTSRILFLRSEREKASNIMMVARGVYDEVADVPIDPFSPGLQGLAGVRAEKLDELRQGAVDRLGLLQAQDPLMGELYLKRENAFRMLTIDVADAKVPTVTVTTQLQQQAVEALNAGNFGRLQELTRKLQEKQPTQTEGQRSAVSHGDLLYPFGAETLAKARDLGMTALRAEPRQQYAFVLQHAWSPKVMEEENGQASARQLIFPSGLPPGIRDRLELYMIHPFITSGGTRLLPRLAAEDFLAEDFPEPAEKGGDPENGVLSALGFRNRRWLSRIDIERALIERGPGIVKEKLGLAPEDFRLVCIPSDLHCRLGKQQGWGQQQVWTHFDGYQVMKGGKLQALAGGDVRFGGIYDMVSFGRDYAQERIIARFAVVQRKRMAQQGG